MKRKASSTSPNDNGVSCFEKEELTAALYHFQIALNSACSTKLSNKREHDYYNLSHNEFAPFGSINDHTRYKKLRLTQVEASIGTVASKCDEGFPVFLDVLTLEYCNEEIATIQFNLGVVYHKMKSYNEALTFYYKSINSLKDGTCELLLMNLHNIAQLHYTQSNYDKALNVYSDLLIFSKDLNANSLVYSSILNCIGVLMYYIDQKNARSIECFEKALSHRLKLSGRYSIAVATILNNMGRAYLSIKNYKEAKNVFQEALCIRRNLLGKDSLDYAVSAKNLAGIFKLLGETDKAISMYSEFLRIVKPKYLYTDAEVVSTLLKLGELQQKQKMYGKAEISLKEFLEISLYNAEDNKEQIIIAFCKLGQFYFELGEYELAISYFRKQLAIEIKLHTIYSKQVGETLMNIAEVHKEDEDFSKAFDFYKYAKTVLEQVLHPNHLCISFALSNIGFIQYQLGNFEESLEMYKKSLHIRKVAWGRNDKEVASLLTQVGLTYIELNQWSAALESLTESLELRNTLNERYNRETPVTLCSIAMIQERLGKLPEAITCLEQALEIESIIFGRDHEEVAMTLLKIGQLLFQSGRLDAALKNLNEALKIQKSQLGEDDLLIARTLNYIGNIYHQKGNVSEMMEAFVQVSRIYRNSGVSPQNISVLENETCLNVLDDHPLAAAAA